MKLEIGVSVDEGDPSDRLSLFLKEDQIVHTIEELFKEVWPESSRYEKVFISIQTVDIETIKNLNKDYRGCDEPTDVLSFPMWEEDGVFLPPEGWSEIVLGDIVLCSDVIAKNAEDRAIPYEKELALMIIHSTLHLLSWDHDTPEKESKMWSIQEKYRDHLIGKV